MFRNRDTIVAPATAPGGALAVIRVSGAEALAVSDRIFRGTAPLSEAAGHTLHYGRIVDGERIVDDVLVSVFRAPRSYTGEEAAEISCHGSQYIVSEVLRLLLAAGARMAEPGEFTVRAYLNGKLDLAQAEAVADLIASSSRAAHALASSQMRGGYSAALDALRDRLLELASLLELELDFSEEVVEFADRTVLRQTMERIGAEIDRLRESFSLGNAIREGVPVAIVGAPNVGKSTLLNRLAGEERALVSEIAGTTRDVIEERVNIDGIAFRFLDTAGIRQTDDRLERMGIERTMQSVSRARIILRMVDAAALARPGCGLHADASAEFSAKTSASIPYPTFGNEYNCPEATPASGPIGSGTDASTEAAATLCTATGNGYPGPEASSVANLDGLRADASTKISAETSASIPGPTAGNGCISSGTAPASDPAGPHTESIPESAELPMFEPHADRTLLTVVNKLDLHPGLTLPEGAIGISARNGDGLAALRTALRAAVDTDALYHGDAVVSNSRHYEALTAAREALRTALDGLREQLPADLLSEEIRQVIRHIGMITGRGIIASDEILGNIFSKFCIGK